MASMLPPFVRFGRNAMTYTEIPRHLPRRWRQSAALARAYATSKSPPRLSPDSQDAREGPPSPTASAASTSSSSSSSRDLTDTSASSDASSGSLPMDWEQSSNYNISKFSELPHRELGFNQHMVINADFKEALRQVLWQFRAPIRYAFAYGSGVFPQSDKTPTDSPKPSPHPHPPEAVTKWQQGGQKTIDFIFGVSFTQHWHSLNLAQNRNHYSFLGSLGSDIVSKVQDNFGAGAYFNPYVTVNGSMIKYGVINLDTIYHDLENWETLYIAGRLQKPVKILRDDARIRLANQVNLISALRTALLMLPDTFTERELYYKIAGLSYMGDARIALNAESPRKVANIVDNQMVNFRQLYLPLILDLPNVGFKDPATSDQNWVDSPELNCKLQQDMDPLRRGNMVRRLPRTFRKRVYDSYQAIFRLPDADYREILDESNSQETARKNESRDFERRIATSDNMQEMLSKAVRQTVAWPTVVQSAKGVLTAGPAKGWRYAMAKREKGGHRRLRKRRKSNIPVSEAC